MPEMVGVLSVRWLQGNASLITWKRTALAPFFQWNVQDVGLSNLYSSSIRLKTQVSGQMPYCSAAQSAGVPVFLEKMVATPIQSP